MGYETHGRRYLRAKTEISSAKDGDISGQKRKYPPAKPYNGPTDKVYIGYNSANGFKEYLQTGNGLFSFSEDTLVKYVFDVSAGTVVGTDAVYIPKTVFLLNNIGKVAELYTFVPNGGMNVNLRVDYDGKSSTTENVTLQKGYATTLEGDIENMTFDVTATSDIQQDL